VWRKRTGRPLNGHNPLTSSMLSDIVHLSDLRQPRAKVSTQWAPEDCPLWEPVVFIAEVVAGEP